MGYKYLDIKDAHLQLLTIIYIILAQYHTVIFAKFHMHMVV